MRYNKVIIGSLLTILLAMCLASINPLDWSSYLLHQAGTIIFVALMLACVNYFKAGNVAFVMGSIFILIHILGARYLYSYVPYDEWTNLIFGFSLTEAMDWHRNMYDRLVHFSYGLLLFPLMFDSLKFYLPKTSTKFLIFLVLLFNLASSAFYELFEWAIAIQLSPEAAEAYNGQQGDIWDAHKDMFLALMGAVAYIALSLGVNKLRIKT